MKKILLSLLLIIILALAAVYLLIPNSIGFSKSITVQVNKEGLYRKLSIPDTWSEWWPGKIQQSKDGNIYTMGGFTFTAAPPKVISLPFSVEGKNIHCSSELTLVALDKDSTTLHIDIALVTPSNPFKRVASYFDSKNLEVSITTLLMAIKANYTTISKLYNYNIQKKIVVDSTLIFTSAETKGIPGTDLIYSLVDKLRDYIKHYSANETGFPMLNIYTRDSINYLVKVAIPVDRKLPDSKDIQYRWMLGGGNILITEVKGGPSAIHKAYEQILNYIADYRRVAPAIPFESLVTDRRYEPDSSKWITRIYYPVM